MIACRKNPLVRTTSWTCSILQVVSIMPTDVSSSHSFKQFTRLLFSLGGEKSIPGNHQNSFFFTVPEVEETLHKLFLIFFVIALLQSKLKLIFLN